MKQQLFKHIFKFLHYTFSLNNSWPQDFGRIKPLTKLEPIKSPNEKLDLKVDYRHQNHSLATSLNRTLKNHHCKLLLQHQVISWTSLRPPLVSKSQGDFETLKTWWILTFSFLNYPISWHEPRIRFTKQVAEWIGTHSCHPHLLLYSQNKSISALYSTSQRE